MKLGRLPHDEAQLARIPPSHLYLAGQPQSCDWSRDLAPGTWGMCGNDTLGDCTAAAVAHALALWGSYVPPMRFMPDDDVVALYSATSGYAPGQPDTDQGARCLDVLARWLNEGVASAGSVEHLSAFCRIDPAQPANVMTALAAFGGIYAGVTLHEAQETETIWNDLSGPVIGGHCVLIAAADDDGLTCITWGETRRMTWPWWQACADEAYALLSPRWIAGGRTPAGLALAALLSDMHTLGMAG